MERDFERWPKYKENYIRAFQRMIDSHPGQIKILREDYQPKNVQFEYETLKDDTVPGKYSGGDMAQPLDQDSQMTDRDRRLGLVVFNRWVEMGAM